MTKIEVSPKSVKAGEEIKIKIIPKDANNNIIEPETISDLFNVYYKNENDEKEIEIKDKIINDDYIEFNVNLIKMGENDIIIKYNNEIFNNENKVEVTYGDIDINNSEIFSFEKIENGEYIYKKIENGDIINSSQDYPLNLYIIFKDKYNNEIKEINENIVKVKNIILSGNNMNPIQFTSSYNNEYIYINLTNKYENEFNNLVEKDNYNFKFDIIDAKNNSNYNEYNYIVNHKTNNDDEGYGNGDYIVSNTLLSPEEIKINAGEEGKINLYLLTSENLKYNNNLENINYITCNIINDDNTFKYNVNKINDKNGEYLITVYSEKKQESYIQVNIINKKGVNENANKVKIIVLNGSPETNYTKYETNIENVTKNEDEKYIKLYISDKYNNTYDKDDYNNLLDKNKLILLTNGEKASIENEIKLITTSNIPYISIILKPKYPPFIYYINILYNDTISYKLLKEDIITNMETSSNKIYPNIISKNINEMKAGDLLQIEIYLTDENDICLITQKTIKAKIIGPLGTENSKTRNYLFNNTNIDDCVKYNIIYNDDNKYTIKGTYSIEIFINGESVSTNYQKVISNEIDYFKVKYNDNYNYKLIKPEEEFYLYLIPYDKYDNIADESVISEMNIILYDIKNNNELELNKNYYYNPSEENIGELKLTFSILKKGNYKIIYKYLPNENINITNKEISNNLIVLSGRCSSLYPNINYDNIKNAILNKKTNFTIKCYDNYGNEVEEGGEQFDIVITLKIYNYIKNEKIEEPSIGDGDNDQGGDGDIDIHPDEYIETITKTNINCNTIDNNDGTYVTSFTPSLTGNYSINVLRDNLPYGEEKTFLITVFNCDICKCMSKYDNDFYIIIFNLIDYIYII